MIKYKVNLEFIEETDEDKGVVSIDTSSLNSLSKEVILDYGEDFNKEVPFINYNIIAGYIKDRVLRGLKDITIRQAIEKESTIEKDDSEGDGEIIESDEPRVSELDIITKLVQKNEVRGFINSIELNGKTLSPEEMGHFSYTKLNSIIVQGPKMSNEVMFNDTLDMEYKLHFGTHIIGRKDGKYTITKLGD